MQNIKIWELIVVIDGGSKSPVDQFYEVSVTAATLKEACREIIHEQMKEKKRVKSIVQKHG